MATSKTDIYVYANWKGLSDTQLIGILSAHAAKGRKAFSFEYAAAWLKSAEYRLLDPDIQFYGGPQFPNNKDRITVGRPSPRADRRPAPRQGRPDARLAVMVTGGCRQSRSYIL